MNNSKVKLDRMWTEGKEYRTDIIDVTNKIMNNSKLNDRDMIIIKYALQMAIIELQDRHINDLKEEIKIKKFSD